MTDVQYYQEKVQKATEKVEKCKGTIARHEKILGNKIKALTKEGIDLTGLNKDEIEKIQEGYRQTETSWKIYEVKHKIDDIKGATKKLEDAEIVLENWKTKLAVEEEKERFLEGNAPQVIKDFLENWKAKCYEWYLRKYNAYLKFSKELDEEVELAKLKIGVKSSMFPSREQRKQLEEMGLDYKSVQAKKHAYAGSVVIQMTTIRNKEEREKWLDKMLEQDKKFKMLDLITRIDNLVGKIMDAQYLEISPEGNLNGYIIGENGKCKVETIGAGGWNIQVFHYRTLVNKIK